MTAIDVIVLGAEALKAIAELIGKRGNTEAGAILDGIATVIAAVSKADIHGVTADEVSNEMHAAVAALANNDAAADAALDKKFEQP